MKPLVDILLIEDRAEDAELTTLALEEHGLTNAVKWVINGSDALSFLRETVGTAKQVPIRLPRLILLDLKMPGHDGLEVLKELKEDASLKEIPVTVLTTSREPKDLKSAYELGANSYIVKPVDFKKFSESIKQLGIYWLLMNETPSS